VEKTFFRVKSDRLNTLFCSFHKSCAAGELFHILVHAGETVGRAREVIARRCEVEVHDVELMHRGAALEDSVVLADVEVGEAEPIVVDGARLQRERRVVIDRTERPSTYDVLLMQLTHVSNQPLIICKRIFDQNLWDYDAALRELLAE
jgi:hypothetical protein